MNGAGYWTPMKVAALEVSEARNLKENALLRARPDIAALCDLRLTLGRSGMLQKYGAPQYSGTRARNSGEASSARKSESASRPVAASKASKRGIQRARLDAKLLKVDLQSQAPAQWIAKLGKGGTVKGTEYGYKITDCNYTDRNRWDVIVQVPRVGSRHDGIVIRLDRDSCPERVAVDKHGI
jgi:hypothetical protein